MGETTYKFIGKWVLNIPGEVIDKLDEEFDVDWSTEDAKNAIMESSNSDPQVNRDVNMAHVHAQDAGHIIETLSGLQRGQIRLGLLRRN